MIMIRIQVNEISDGDGLYILREVEIEPGVWAEVVILPLSWEEAGKLQVELQRQLSK